VGIQQLVNQEQITMLRDYIDLVKLALSQMDASYYRLLTTYNQAGIVRERIFCYELYHQIRSCMRPDHDILSLHGEIDKGGHADFAVDDQFNPDFVFHVPGTHEFNTLVIEVKGNLHKKGILKDFTTLLTFTSKYQYKAGIFILFGHSFGELIDAAGEDLRLWREHPRANSIHILTIELPFTDCVECLLSEV
jgi:hypothetical protein